ncbi:MAG: asparagine synthase (glutamine-hydrolyzing) [Candidatus Jettenia caeni]|nr:asparagine synthase (glutamine-hydrolyzing) [Candidatus Jettenia caeni]
MCGIAGIFNYKNTHSLNPSLLRRMCKTIAHRGPDDEGFYMNQRDRLGIGHRRLSIIDLKLGKQPMSNFHESIWIVFNGEIYNFIELKKELQAKGYRFRTTSDTEVIILLYEEYGEKGFERLNGIFAFAIYDKNKRSLILVRDHFGVKPLYYWIRNGRVLFASEMKAIFQDDSVEKELDSEALNSFLTFRYNPSPQTLFKHVKKLYPGHYLKITFEGGWEMKSYWENIPKINTRITENDAAEEYRRLLTNAVKRQMMSDVPVGLLLSGGVDSAVLGYLMQKNYSEKVKTFTVGFPGSGDYNELHDARSSAQFIESEHHDITISYKDYLDFFYRSFSIIEEPIAETAIPALYYVSKFASNHLKVVLAGQGADEPMAGYHRYLGAHFISKYADILRNLPLTMITKFLSRNERLKRAAYVSQFSGELERILAVYTIFTPVQQELLYNNYTKSLNKSMDEELIYRLYSQTKELPDMLSKILYIDTRMSLSDDLLLFNDKVTMANSLEMRVPFLDIELVQFLESLPRSLKLKGTQRKYIHKRAVECWLPKEIIYRRKRGFMTPMDEWLQDDLAITVKEILMHKDSACKRYFNLDYINQLIELHKSRRENYQKHIFVLLSFEMWHKTFLENQEMDRGTGKIADNH